MQNEKWARLAYVSGLVNQRLLLQCEYLAAENRILRSHLPSRLVVSRLLGDWGSRPAGSAQAGRKCTLSACFAESRVVIMVLFPCLRAATHVHLL